VRNVQDIRRILIVEDNDFLAVDLELTLSRCGYSPLIVSAVPSALEQIAGQPLDAAILDVSLLPGEWAYGVADALHGAHIPFVFLTGRPRSYLPKRFQEVPLLSKPYKLAELLAALDKIIAASPPIQAARRDD
jgi:CheY-like chemotaxis protein